MPSVLEYTLGKCYVCRVPDIMHSANRKHSALSPFPVVHQYNYEKVHNIPSEGPLDVYFIGDEPHYRAESIEQDEK